MASHDYPRDRLSFFGTNLWRSEAMESIMLTSRA